jgi:hypothetical protein
VEVGDGAEDAAFEALAGEGGEEVLDGIGCAFARSDRQARLGAVERLDLMGWMAPSLHRRAMLVAVEGHRSEEPS